MRRYHATHTFQTIVRLGLIAAVAACGGSDGAPVAAAPSVATVTVVPNLVTIAPGETTPLTATVADAAGNALSGRSVTWSSSNTAMVTIAANGVATGVAEGSATITATSEGKRGDATIVVGTATISPSIGAGLLGACGVGATATAFCWGAGFSGALGDGTKPTTPHQFEFRYRRESPWRR